jgi:invasion protein IalB
MLMTGRMRSAFVVALTSAAVISGNPASAGEQWPRATAEPLKQLYYSPWGKFCGKGRAPLAREVCFTGADGRTEAGQPVVAAALIEPEGEPKKLFRVTLPGQLDTRYGARIVIDGEPPASSAFFRCFANGCMADFEATPELVELLDRLRKGRMLQIQAVNHNVAVITFPLPLVHSSENSFASAHDGPPIDSKVFEEQQRKLQRPLVGDFPLRSDFEFRHKW